MEVSTIIRVSVGARIEGSPFRSNARRRTMISTLARGRNQGNAGRWVSGFDKAGGKGNISERD